MKSIWLLCLLALPWGTPASAQLVSAPEARVIMGHHHLNVTDIGLHKKFWVDLLGGTPAKLGPLELVKFHGVLVFLRQEPPAGGTKGTSVDHIGFQAPDIKPLVEKLKAAGFPIVTRAEIPGGRADGDIFYSQSQKTHLAFVMGPDQIKVELVENPALGVPIAHHHIHFSGPDPEAMKAWYVKMFGAAAGRRGTFEAADLPGVNLTFSPAQDEPAGTKGRVLDHTGFEVKDLAAFCKKLEAGGVQFDRPYQQIPALNLAIAFLTDPWGTYLELTEGLDRL